MPETEQRIAPACRAAFVAAFGFPLALARVGRKGGARHA